MFTRRATRPMLPHLLQHVDAEPPALVVDLQRCGRSRPRLLPRRSASAARRGRSWASISRSISSASIGPRLSGRSTPRHADVRRAAGLQVQVAPLAASPARGTACRSPVMSSASLGRRARLRGRSGFSFRQSMAHESCLHSRTGTAAAAHDLLGFVGSYIRRSGRCWRPGPPRPPPAGWRRPGARGQPGAAAGDHRDRNRLG